VTGVGALDGIHGKRADDIGKFTACGHRTAAILWCAVWGAAALERVEKGARIFHYAAHGSNHERF
jgi:hypothetical protein